MPTKRKIRLNNISSIPAAGAAGVALIDVPLSFGRCHEIHFQLGTASGATATLAAAVALVTEIRVILNGTVVRTMSGAELRDQNVLNGSTYDMTGLPQVGAGVDFPIFFAEPSRKDVRDQDSLAWSSKPMNSFKVEIALASNVIALTLQAFAVVDDVILDKPSSEILFVKWIRQTFNGGSTETDVTTIDRRGFIQQVTLYPASQALTEVIVKKDGLIISELKRTQNDSLLAHHGMLTVGATGRIANVWDVVFDHDDLLGSSLDMRGSRDFIITAKCAVANASYTGIIQRAENLD